MEKLLLILILLLFVVCFFKPEREAFASLPPYHPVWLAGKKQSSSNIIDYAGIPITKTQCTMHRNKLLSKRNLSSKTLAEQCEIKHKLEEKRKEAGLCHGQNSSIKRLGRDAYHKCIQNGGHHKRCSCYKYCLCVNKSGNPRKCDTDPIFKSCIATDHDEPTHFAVRNCT